MAVPSNKGRGAAPAKAKGRKPDWTVNVLDKVTEKRGQVGVAWDQDDGSISISLNACVVIDTRVQDLMIRLFPNDRDEEF